jgi:hypothetical protein
LRLAPLCVLAVALAAWLCACDCRAETVATLIVLVADSPDDAVAERLQRDLRGLGFGVIVLNATPENSGDVALLERATRSLGGIAAVRILPDAQGSQLWVLEPISNRSVTRTLSRPTGASADLNEVALGTLELLRASMLELHPPPAAPPAAPQRPPPAAPSAVVHETAPAFSLSAGVGAELGLRSASPSWSGLFAAWLELGGCFGVRGFAALPAKSERMHVSEGDVEVRPTLLGIGLACGTEAQQAFLSPRVGLGFALAHVATRGTAMAPDQSHDAESWLGGGYGLLGVGFRITPDIKLGLDATGVVLPTPAVILVKRREVATWGAPGVVASLSLEVSTGR